LSPDAPDVVEEQPPALTEQAEEILSRLRTALGDGIVDDGGAYGGLILRVRRDAWLPAAEAGKGAGECDYLSFISAIDWMPAPALADEGSGDTSNPVQPRETTYGVTGSEGRFQVFAHLESTQRQRWGVTLKVDVDENDPRLPSWVGVYPGADWHERETWEMYGVVFDGHPSLRHLYLPHEFEGNPLRKDYPLLAREVKPWPGLVDVEPMLGDAADAAADADEASAE